MLVNPDNPVVKLCIQGMKAESQGRLEEVRAIFAQAWDARQDDVDACIAAHYLARRAAPTETVRWNQAALNHASAANDERVEDFYPSLSLDLGWSYEELGIVAEAERHYALAQQWLDRLTTAPDGDVVRQGLVAARLRLAKIPKVHHGSSA